jgi:rhomboid protease GluP
MEPVSANASQFPRSFLATYVLLGINTFVYFFLLNKGGATYENLILFGAKENGLIAEGEIWRLFFPMFLHDHGLHLFINMWGLYQIGRYLEFLVGAKNLLVVYLIAGVTGNLCSFAFQNNLSVGASSSLFGIMLCLYVLQKYEEKLAEEAGVPVMKSSLGTVIIVNLLLPFAIPNIDWASHMGGAIAGALFALAMVARHKWNVKLMRAAKFLGFRSQLPKPALYQRVEFFYALLILVNVGFALSVFRIGLSRRVFGLGVQQASYQTQERRTEESLHQFQRLLMTSKETAPERLFDGTLNLHRKGHFLASALLYEVIATMHRRKLGGEDFLSSSTWEVLRVSTSAALKGQPPPQELKDFSFGPEIVSHPENISEFCSAPGTMLMALGFYELSGKLFECAYYLDISKRQFAVDAMESYWLSEPESPKTSVQRFLENLDSIEKLKGLPPIASHPLAEPEIEPKRSSPGEEKPSGNGEGPI